MLLVRQYRLPARQYLWELPAGRIDAGRDAAEGRQAGVGEETGYRGEEVDEAGRSSAPSPGFLAEKMTIYAGAGPDGGRAATPMDDERIECQWFTLGRRSRG